MVTITHNRRSGAWLIRLVWAVVTVAVLGAFAQGGEIKKEFEPTWQSLEQYECPDWFRDGKLGIFICWSPVSVPGVDDWYPRNMYIEGHRAYEYHVKTYGHPSKVGYKDVIEMWKGEKFDADELVGLFKEAGAKYIVPIATYHDNFDLWNSKHHRWNSVNFGPGKDVIGMWREATRKHGLRFGVTTHLVRTYNWFQTSKDADKNGPLKGVPYDGNDPDYEDLYSPKHDDSSFRYPKNPSEAWKQSWFERIKDLVDQHRPDLLYFDGGVPFGRLGREMIAYYYNQNMSHHGGKLEAVLNIKDNRHGDFRLGMCVLDLERGLMGDLRDEPWQNDTSIGPWFYQPNAKYKSVDSIIDSFIDIVSKNGNLLLNVPPRPDGTLDDKAVAILRDIGQWLKINGPAIYGTRPWIIYGEGPTKIASGDFSERKLKDGFAAQDVRFTTKNDTLYAIVLNWPGKQLTIKSLSTKQKTLSKIESITMLGHAGQLKWTRNEQGLTIQLPETKPCEYAFAFKIE